jgi:hypothetical protein
MVGRKSAVVAALIVMGAIGVSALLNAGDSQSVKLKGIWPKQPLSPTAIFDDSFELSVKDGRIHVRCGSNFEGEVRRITYDKASDVLTLEDVAIDEPKSGLAHRVRVLIVAHRTTNKIPKGDILTFPTIPAP